MLVVERLRRPQDPGRVDRREVGPEVVGQAPVGALERYRSPQARLKGFVRAIVEQRDLAARYGCPHGSLCQELDKRDDDLQRSCAELLELPVRWGERQFREMGRRDARELAVGLIAAWQGALLLSNTFRDPDLTLREGSRLERWIDSLV